MKQPRNDRTRAQEQARRDANREKIRTQARAAHAQRVAADPMKERMRWRKSAGILDLPESEPQSGTPCDCCKDPIIGIAYADHDHVTMKFRGWVHPRCNIWLSALDEPGWLELGLAYLTRARR